ncbi:hypothetical protein AGR7C_Lc10002 [Agrobacterium deltaense Zutra 3/1]|uniref:Uncharacterized protein n=1 Tax=Agrobacterium deltaense Zutra 3/1 TaxID=1183427 RepID=A0A1S7QN38_9HYPH|nr:hypothetical protein AGR7C_Lc10002 [Agrobacterium deltaense Zutra 3/1]
MSSLVDRAEMQEGGDMSSAAAFQVVVFEDWKGGVVIVCVMVPDQAAALRSKFAWITS